MSVTVKEVQQITSKQAYFCQSIIQRCCQLFLAYYILFIRGNLLFTGQMDNF